MMESRPTVTALDQADAIFLQRSRKRLKVDIIVGWFGVGVSVIGGALIATNFEHIWAASGFQALQAEIMRPIYAQNEQLRALRTTMPLERELVQTLIEKNMLAETMLNTVNRIGLMIFFLWILLVFLLQGIASLSYGYLTRRYLRIIEAFERQIRLSKG